MLKKLFVADRKRVVSGTYYRVRVVLEKQVDRKLYMSATLENNSGEVLADATSLFIIARPWYEQVWRFFFKG